MSAVANSQTRKRNKRQRLALTLLLVVLGLGLLLFVIVMNTSYSFQVDGDAMLPTLKSGESVLVNKAIYAFGRPQRGDIVVFKPPAAVGTNDDFIKRVIAVEGETVEIRLDSNPSGEPGHDCGDCGVYVNVQRLDEPYVRETPDYEVERIVVPPGKVFVLGDNRRNSYDSHVWGPLEVSRIRGKVLFK